MDVRKSWKYHTLLIVVGLALGGLVVACAPAADEKAAETEAEVEAAPSVVDNVMALADLSVEGELPVRGIPHPGLAAEAYFSPDSQSMITNLKDESAGDEFYQVYTFNLDGSDVKRINKTGHDACSYYFPDGDKLIWTSTRDKGVHGEEDYSNPDAYPTGSELYVSDLDGGNVQMVTDNDYYDAEVSISPDGQWILFTRQIDGALDMWRMHADGTGEEQITDTPDLQEGGAFYMPDNETVIYRAWDIADQGQRGMPMTLFTMNHDGSDRKQVSVTEGLNWAPFPTPDGKHVVFVRMSEDHNFDTWMLNIESGEQQQLTFSPSFDGYPAISPDGHWMSFTSTREAPEDAKRNTRLYLMDISSLNVGP